MKYSVAILLCAIIVTASAAPSVDPEKIEASARKVKEAHDACNKDPATHVEKPKHHEGKHDETHVEPANFGAHVLCVSKNLGWQKADGSVDVDVIRARATALFGENPKLEEIIAECSKPQETDEATAKHLYHCYRKNAPRPAGVQHTN